MGPGDLLRVPADVIGGVRRLVDEVVAVRLLLESTDAWLYRDVQELKQEFARVRERVDEIADSAPTRGPVEKVKDALTPD